MLRSRIDELRGSFSDIFNLRDDEAKGRTINLASTLLTALFNVFITGIFYTGYLTMELVYDHLYDDPSALRNFVKTAYENCSRLEDMMHK